MYQWKVAKTLYRRFDSPSIPRRQLCEHRAKRSRGRQHTSLQFNVGGGTDGDGEYLVGRRG